jgi:hypothetical protein
MLVVIYMPLRVGGWKVNNKTNRGPALFHNQWTFGIKVQEIMTHFKVFFLFCFLQNQVIFGQNDSITRLREVIVSDVKLNSPVLKL